MQKRLILNADDFGWDKDASAGILSLVEADKLHNVSVMSNLSAEKDLIGLQLHTARISTGLHITLNSGSPLYNASDNSLLTEQGVFYSSKELFKKALFGQISYKDIYNEVYAQYSKMLEAGLRVSHADSHQHIHRYPVLGPMILNVLKEIGIAKIRNCKPLNIYDQRRIILTAFCGMSYRNSRSFIQPEVLITDFTDKHFDFNTRPQTLLKRIASGKYKTIEWMCHPAFADRTDSYLQRKKEFDFLNTADWNVLLKGTNITLGQYKTL